jgi:hypothetical protein
LLASPGLLPDRPIRTPLLLAAWMLKAALPSLAPEHRQPSIFSGIRHPASNQLRLKR